MPPVLQNVAILFSVAHNNIFCMAHDVAANSSISGMLFLSPRLLMHTIMCEQFLPLNFILLNFLSKYCSAVVSFLYS